MNPNRTDEREKKIQKLKAKYKDIFGKLDLETAYENLFRLLWYTRLPCYDIGNITSNALHQMSVIKQCFWKEDEINCSALFKPMPSDRGMCCSFNLNSINAFLKESKFQKVIDELQKSDQKHRYVDFFLK